MRTIESKSASVLLIFPPLSSKRSLRVTTCMPPQGVTGIAAVLEREGIRVRILDLNFAQQKGIPWRPLLRDALGDMRPAAVGITCTTPAVLNVLEIAADVKSMCPSSPVFAGGPHPSALPESLLRISRDIDAVVCGEGEYASLELIRRALDHAPFSDIPGVASRGEGEAIKSRPGEVIADLDELPFPARHLLPPLHEYYYAGHCYDRLPVTSIVTSRGCPQFCRFCSQAVFGHKYRARGASSVVSEIGYLKKKHGVRCVMFMDETFTADKRRVYDFCARMRKENLKVTWLCYAGINEVDDDMLRDMKGAGCFQVYYGIESGVQRLLDLMHKKIDVDRISAVVARTRAAGLEVRGQFMLNYFNETREDIQKTIAFARKLKLDYAEFSVFFPLPGSEVFSSLSAEGRISFSRPADFEVFQQGTSLFLDPIIVLGKAEKTELRGLVKKAYRDFYLRAGYILGRLLKIRSVQDIRKNLEGMAAFTAGLDRFYKEEA